MGGVNTFRNVLAEDYLIGSAFHEMGYTVKMAPKAVRFIWTNGISGGIQPLPPVGENATENQFSGVRFGMATLRNSWAVLGFYAALSIGNTSAALLIASLFTLRSMGDVLHASRHENAWTLVGPVWMPIRDSFALAMWFGA